MDPKKVQQYIKLARKAGVRWLKVDGLELELGHEPETAPTVVEPAKEVQDAPAYDDETLLLWSTQHPTDN